MPSTIVGLDFRAVDFRVLVFVCQGVFRAHIDACEGAGQHEENYDGNDDFLEESGLGRELSVLPNDVSGL